MIRAGNGFSEFTLNRCRDGAKWLNLGIEPRRTAPGRSPPRWAGFSGASEEPLITAASLYTSAKLHTQIQIIRVSSDIIMVIIA